jgi:hypothetical protein
MATLNFNPNGAYKVYIQTGNDDPDLVWAGDDKGLQAKVIAVEYQEAKALGYHCTASIDNFGFMFEKDNSPDYAVLFN